MPKKYECIVCGKKFPEGQGILIEFGDITLSFHSKSCALKFFKTLLSRIEFDIAKKYVSEVVEEFRKRITDERRLKAKKI